MSSIEFRSVTKTYRNRRVIDALSFTIAAGERIVLFGPSGCGKSTTLLLIAGLTPPDSGAISIEGKIVSAARRIVVPPQLRGVAMVFQDLALWPHMTVADNVAYGLTLRRLPRHQLRYSRLSAQRCQTGDPALHHRHCCRMPARAATGSADTACFHRSCDLA